MTEIEKMNSVLDPKVIPELIGQPHDGETVQALFKELEIVWEDIHCLDKDLQWYVWESHKKGIQVEFEDEGVLFSRPYHDIGDGPFILTSIALWGNSNEFFCYEGPMKSGIQFTDSREIVIEKIGTPTKKNDDNSIWRWQFDSYKITIEWEDSNKIRVISYWYTPDAER